MLMDFIGGTLLMERDKDMVHLNGIMERNLKGTGKME
jgi:hypothetical protein